MAYHPQTSGQAKVSNRELKRILEKTVAHHSKDWTDQLNNGQWAYWIAYKTLTGSSPYRLVYGKACHIQVEFEHKAYWANNFRNLDFSLVGEKRKMQLNELDEWRALAYENSRLYKDKEKQYHDKHIMKNKKFWEGGSSVVV